MAPIDDLPHRATRARGRDAGAPDQQTQGTALGNLPAHLRESPNARPFAPRESATASCGLGVLLKLIFDIATAVVIVRVNRRAHGLGLLKKRLLIGEDLQRDRATQTSEIATIARLGNVTGRWWGRDATRSGTGSGFEGAKAVSVEILKPAVTPPALTFGVLSASRPTAEQANTAGTLTDVSSARDERAVCI